MERRHSGRESGSPSGENGGGGGDGEVVEVRVEDVVHKVVLPPPRSSVKKLKMRFKETLFPDDPFRHFKGMPCGTKAVMAFQYVFPILSWAPNYSFSLFKSDLIAGLTIASLAIPQGISYAKLANLPPIIGLFSSFVPPLVYAVLGSSRDLAVGPTSIASLVMGSMLLEVANPNTDMGLFLQLAFTSTFFAGVFQASLGVLRLGFIVDFISKATLIGFMAGAAIIVSLQQLKGLLGIVHFTKKMGLVQVLESVFSRTDEWSWETIVMGIFFLLLLLLARHISMRSPKFFWVSAGAPLASVILSTAFSYLIKAQNHGISIIGKLKSELNEGSWDKLNFDGSHIGVVCKTGIVTGILSLTEGIAVGRTFGALKDYKVDGNKEMMAIGIMNIVGSCTSCYVTTGAFSRSAVNNNAGCKTAMSNIIMALTVMVTLLFLMPLFAYTPNVVLAAIIISAVVGLIDIHTAYQIWKMDKMDFLVCICALFGVVFLSVQEGLAFAVGLSIFRILLQIIRPKMVILGNMPGSEIYRNLHHYKDARRVPGFLIVAVEAPINFANTNYLNERIARLIEDEKAEEKQVGLQFLILDLSGVSAVDTSGVALLVDLKRTMEKRSIEVVFVNPLGEVMEKMQRANEMNTFLGPDSLFLTVGMAVLTLSSNLKAPV